MFNRDVYDYEVSIWTLQDGFITVLKPSETEIKGQIQDGKVLIKDDGTREFSFSIPMYLYKGNEKFENPAWYNTTNGNILVNLRKLKVIFNKKTLDEKVFEFLITKVTEEHQNGTLICHIESEGLAFHELGKIGYQISLSSDDFVDDYNTWVANGGENSDKEEPISNINYWCDKVFSYITGWTYEVQMDWRGYYTTVMESDKLINFARDSHTIYEDAIGILGPDTEKCRLLDIEESNVYNITQTIAELFGVFCRYEYSYDENYHIIGKKVIFYNNFLKESEGAYDLNYPYSTSDISREINSADVVTKMFVRPLQDANTATGLIDIIDVKENTIKENYILNFEYLHDIGTITEEQYQAISQYQNDMRYYNEKLIPLESEIVSLQAQKPLIESQVTFSINAMRLDQQQLDTQNDLLNSLTGEKGVISRGLTNPEQLLLREDKNNTTATEKVYFVNLTQHGIDPATLQLYKTYQVTNTGTSVDGEAHTRVSDRINTGQFEYDDYGDLVRVSNIYSDSAGYIYAVYDYDPRVYYERVIETWTNRLDQDTANYNLNEQKRLDLIARLNTLIDEQTLLIKEKEDTIAKFNKMMGAALREGYWQPEDYTDYKDRYLNYYNFNPTVAEITSSRTNEFDSFVWDATPFEGEQSLYTKIGADQKKYTYPCIDLTAGNLPNIFSDPAHIQQLSFLFYDFDNFTTSGNTSNVNAGRLRNFTIGSKCQYGFLKRSNGVIKPVLILTGMETVPNYRRQYPTAFSWWRANAALMVNNKDVYVVDNLENWDMYRLALPAGSRIKITSLTRNSAVKGVLPMAYEYNNYYYPLDLNEVGETITADALLINYLRTTDEYSIESVGYDITGAPFVTPEANVIGYLGALTVEKINNVNTAVKADWSQSVPREAWIEPTEEDELVFPRIRIKSLSLQDDESNLQLYYNNSTEPLKKYEDYSVLIRTDEEAGAIPDTIDYITSNYITIKPDILLRSGINPEVNTRLSISYAISNANLSIYLDALQISKENAYPKVSYSVTPNVFDSKFLRTLYTRLSQIVHINDTDLHLKYVQGYISELDLDLDHPWNSSVEVKNYKNKFEDLFSTIVAQTEAMKKTSGTIYNISQVVSGGSITGSALQSSLIKVDLNYAFNNGTLTINEKDGIWGVSDAGVVAFRGGGIFLANEKDSSGNWIWNTGLVPQGINANLITSGQLDTNRVMIYAGDKLRFQFNSDGLFAYKSFFEDLSIDFNNQETPLDPTDTPWFTKELNVQEVNKALRDGLGIDGAQYVKFDSNGIFFNLKKGALVLNEKKTDYITIGKYYYTYEREVGVDANGNDTVIYTITPHDSNDPEYGSKVATIPEEFARVSLTWDGFTLRNYNGERIFYLSAESGDIFMKGNLIASDLHIANENGDLILFDDYLDLSTEEIVQGIIDNVQAHLMSISDKVDLLNEDFTNSLAYVNELLSHIPVNLLEIDNKINLLAADFQDSLDEGNRAIDQIQGNLQTVNGRIDDLVDDFEGSIADANAELDNLQVNILEINNKVDSLNAEFDRELSDAQQALTTNLNNQMQTINARVDTLTGGYTGTLNDLSTLINNTRTEMESIVAGDSLLASYYTDATWASLSAHGYKVGDIWEPDSQHTYIAVDTTGVQANDWALMRDETFIDGAKLKVDAEAGNIELKAANTISMTAGDLSFTGNKTVSFGAGVAVNIASGQNINIVTSGTSSNVVNAIQMNGSGIKISSGSIIELLSKVNNSDISSLKMGGPEGIQIASNRKITFYSNEGLSSPGGAAVEISKERILFGVSNAATATAVDIDANGFVITNGGVINGSNVSAFSPLSTAGMKITNAMIGMSVASGSAKNLFWMDDSGVEIGSLSTSTTSGLKAVNVNDGSYALIKRTDGIEFGTKNSYGASIVSMRSQRVLIATRTGATKTLSSTTYYPISAMDVQGEKLVFVSGLSMVDVQKKFSDDGAANTTNTFNPRDSRLSGFRMTSTDLGMSLTTQNGTSSNYPTAKSLFWMDKDGIEMGSVGASNDASQSALLNGSYVFIKNSSGVEIGAAPANSNGSIASFRQTGRALFAARANSKVGVVDIQPTKVVITAGESNATIPQNFDTTGIAATSNSFNPRGTNAISGIRIQQENLGMAVVTNAGKSLFWLDGDGLELGSVGSNKTAASQENLLTGAYVFIKHNSGVEIGAAPASTDGTVASIRKTGRALFAARASSSTSVVDIQPTKVVIAAGSSNKTVPKNFANDTTGDISYDSNNFDPRTDTTGISGVRIRQTDLGMAIVDNSKNPGKSLFWMDKDGLELGTINTANVASAQTQTLKTSDLLTGSYVFIKNQHGVEIGSGNTGTDGGIVSIQQQRVAIAVGSSTNASIIDMVDGKVIITSGARFGRNFANLSNSYDTFDPLSSDKSGVRITKENIGMAVVANTDLKNLIWMDSSGLEIGSVGITSNNTASTGKTAINTAKGAYVTIKHASGVEIGAGSTESAGRVNLYEDGTIHAVYGSNTSINYAAFNLGKGGSPTSSSYGFESEVTGRLTLWKRTGVTGVYPFQLTSENYQTTVLALRSWSSSPTNSAIASASGYGITIQAVQPTTKNNTTTYPKLIAIRRTASDVFTVDGQGYMEVEKIVVTNTAADNIIHTYPRASTSVNGGANATASIRDTIKSYTVETIDNKNYVSTLTLASGEVLNFKHPTSGSGASLNSIQVSASGSGANVDLTLSATGQTSRTINDFGTLHIYNPDGSPTINSSIIFDTTGNNTGTSANSAAIGLNQYWSAAQSAVTHNPTFTVVNVTGAGIQPHSFNITPSCSGTNGTSVTYKMAITASFTNTVISIPAKTTNFSRSDRVTLLQDTNIVRNAYFNLSSYWDAAQSASNLALVTPKDSSSYYITANNNSSPGNTPTQDSSIAILASTVNSSATTVTTSNVLATIGLNNYWQEAQKATNVALVENLNTDENAKKVKIRRIPNDGTTDTDWLATLVYDTANSKVLLTSNGTTSGIKYAEIGISNSITYNGLAVRGTGSSSSFWNKQPYYIEINNKLNINGTEKATYIFDLAYHTANNVEVNSASLVDRTNKIVIYDAITRTDVVTWPLANYWDSAQSKVKLVNFNENTVSDMIQMTNSSDTNYIGKLHLTFSAVNDYSYDRTSNIILTSNLNDNVHTIEENDKLYASINLGQYWDIAQESIQFIPNHLKQKINSNGQADTFEAGEIRAVYLLKDNNYVIADKRVSNYAAPKVIGYLDIHNDYTSDYFNDSRSYIGFQISPSAFGGVYYLGDYWNNAQSAVTVAFNTPPDNLNDTVTLVKNNTLTAVTAKLYQDGNTVYLSADGTSNTVKYAKLNITSTYIPTISISNNGAYQNYVFAQTGTATASYGTSSTPYTYYMYRAANASSSNIRESNYDRTDTINFEFNGSIRNSIALEKYWDAAQDAIKNTIKIDTINFGTIINSNYITATANSNVTGTLGSIQYGIGYYRASSLTPTTAGFRMNTSSYTADDVILVNFNNVYERDSCVWLNDYWNYAQNKVVLLQNSNSVGTNHADEVYFAKDDGNGYLTNDYTSRARLRLTYSTRGTGSFDDTSNIILCSQTDSGAATTESNAGIIYARINLAGFWNVAKSSIQKTTITWDVYRANAAINAAGDYVSRSGWTLYYYDLKTVQTLQYTFKTGSKFNNSNAYYFAYGTTNSPSAATKTNNTSGTISARYLFINCDNNNYKSISELSLSKVLYSYS